MSGITAFSRGVWSIHYINSLVKRITAAFPARYTGKQKQAFRAFLLRELTDLGWEAEVITGGRVFRSQNVVTKSPEADVLLLAHYDTIGRDPLGGLIGRVVGYKPSGQLIGGALVGLALVRVGDMLHRIALAAGLPRLLLLPLELLVPLVLLLPLFLPNKHCLNDNTSGVITLLNIARVLNEYPALKGRIQLAFVDLEEVGLFGSRHLRRHLLTVGIDLQRMNIINLDCVGWGQVPVVCSAGNRAKAEALYHHLRSSRPDVALSNMPSDHMSFRREGAAAVIFGNPALLGKNFYVPNVHSSRDIHLDPSNIAWLTEELVRFYDNN